MVWSQYVYEASTGYETPPSDEERDEEYELQVNVEDWQTKYSDELWALWDMIQQLIKDAFLEYELMTECTFSDFAEFCYVEHDDDCDFVWIPYESTLSYIWRHIQDFIDICGLHHEFMVDATFDHWVRFAFQHSDKKYVTVY